ncbi:MAG TPA: cyclic pyranopterin monophosphate synthase MoaC [Chloroflexota bacterium]|nr:cyclic pyranopterin monophosphate synthase MoaC [Chloroflexota bacterium]
MDADGGRLTHVDEAGAARMVDVSKKSATARQAVARGRLAVEAATLDLIEAGRTPKGDVLSVARVAGIMAAKKTSDLIPLCHQVPLAQVTVDFEICRQEPGIEVIAQARTTASTGVEMEALVAVTVAALTLYDMVKAVDRSASLHDVRVTHKSGGRSGSYSAE